MLKPIILDFNLKPCGGLIVGVELGLVLLSLQFLRRAHFPLLEVHSSLCDFHVMFEDCSK